MEVKNIIGIDPGSTKSAYIYWDGKEILEKGILPNEQIIDMLDAMWREPAVLAIESMVHITMGGKETVDTLLWAGRFYQAWQGEKEFVPVHVVRGALAAKNDPGIRAILIARFGEPGTKKNPGFTHGLQGKGYHLWRAFGLCVYYMDHLAFQAKILD